MLQLFSQQTKFSRYTQDGNKLDFLGNKNSKDVALGKPQRGEINIAKGIAPGKPQRGDINKAWGIAPGKRH
ncbi:MAG: hypothetical protein DRR08_08740 [Candidatus Parabeggiatoa sp. nov. 2]|nr:MAG: hypothetical protein B6247_22710 [Beggiatoa sp. 4572_84]RKZ61422.1 MAG: hypothetical protein DRR08_08740 [Gammaproteobacteria bacterium]